MSRMALIVALSAGLTMTGAASSVAIAQARGDKGIIVVDGFAGRITGIKGTAVTVKSEKGVEHTFELASAAGVAVGAMARCEIKGCQRLQILGKSVKVNRVAR